MSNGEIPQLPQLPEPPRWMRAFESMINRIPGGAVKAGGAIIETILVLESLSGLLTQDYGKALGEAGLALFLGSMYYLNGEPQRARRAYHKAEDKVLENPYRAFVKEGALAVAENIDQRFGLSEKFGLPEGNKQKLLHTYMAAHMVSFRHTIPQLIDEAGISQDMLHEILSDMSQMNEEIGYFDPLNRLINEQIPVIHQGLEQELLGQASTLRQHIDDNQGHWSADDISYAGKTVVDALQGGGRLLLLKHFLPQALQGAKDVDVKGLRQRHYRKKIKSILENVVGVLEGQSDERVFEFVSDKVALAVKDITYRKGTN